MPNPNEKSTSETSGNENGDSGTSSSSEVSIDDEGDENNRLILGSDESCGEESVSSGEDDDRSSESGSSESEDESSSGDSGSSDSLWEAFDDGDKKQTQEASEASALLEFQRALDCLVKGKNLAAAKILKQLLENPLVKGFKTSIFDWEAEVDERLSKMARLFVGIHKNLAKLEEGCSADHFLQILSVAPKNAEIWLNLGLESISRGDVDFAKFAFQHAEGPQATDALLSALYLSRNCHACLRMAQKCLELGVCQQKALFLKERIRSINSHYSEYCDNIFMENRRYDEVLTLNENIAKEIAQRLECLEEKLRAIPTEDYFALPSPIDIEFDAQQSIVDVATCFCDLYDRVEAYSNLSVQEITFSRWDDRRDFVDSMKVIEEIATVVEIVESLLSEVLGRCAQESSVTYYGSSDSFLRRSMRYAMEIPFDEGNFHYESNNATLPQFHGSLPTSKLADYLGLSPKHIEPLKKELATKSSPTPTAEPSFEYIDSDALLFLLMTTLRGGSWTLFQLLELFLCLIADMSPALGAIPPFLQEVLIQCYRRFNRLSSNLCDAKYIRLHVLMDELVRF